MRFTYAPLIFAAFALAACNSGDSVKAENESVESVAKKVAASDIKPQPGRWESTVKMESLDMEGLPPQAKEAMAQQMNKASKFTSCLTPEQVNQPNGGFFAGGVSGCTYKHFSMAGGKIDAEMTCGQDAGMVQAMAMNGTYSDTSYDIKMTTQTEAQPGKVMKMSLGVVARRTGECDGKEDITAKDVADMQKMK